MISCWDTMVQSYRTSASKIKSFNCLAWPHLYFLFMTDGWNACGKFLRFSLFFEILSGSWKNCKKNTRKMWFLVIKTTNCRPGHFYTFYSWHMFEILWHIRKTQNYKKTFFISQNFDSLLRYKGSNLLHFCTKNLWCSKEKEGTSGKMLLSEHKKD